MMAIPSEVSSDRKPQQLDDADMEAVVGSTCCEFFVPTPVTKSDQGSLVGPPLPSGGSFASGGAGCKRRRELIARRLEAVTPDPVHRAARGDESLR